MPRPALERLQDFDCGARASFAGARLFAGVDEVGRGPLAGPVVAAAVIFIRPFKMDGLNDSKQVAPQKRSVLFWEILKSALVGIGICNEAEIDRINIYQASRLAMKRALLSLTRTPDFALIDGNAEVQLPIPQKTVIKGDAKSASIAAASIVAKVYRDNFMDQLDLKFPGYGFSEHKGYATPLHLDKIRAHGPSPVHRKSFSPIRQFYEKAVL